MHSWRFYARSYRRWVTDNAINETAQRTIELKNSENRTVVVFQVKKSHQGKQTFWRNHEKREADVDKCGNRWKTGSLVFVKMEVCVGLDEIITGFSHCFLELCPHAYVHYEKHCVNAI